jgi:hypothetical protein
MYQARSGSAHAATTGKRGRTRKAHTEGHEDNGMLSHAEIPLERGLKRDPEPRASVFAVSIVEKARLD